MIRLSNNNRTLLTGRLGPFSWIDFCVNSITSTSVPLRRLAQAPHSSNPSVMAFATLFLASIALGANTVLNLARVALDAPEYSHLLLIVPLAAGVIWQERKLIFVALNPRPRTTIVSFCSWSLAGAILALIVNARPVDERLAGSVLLLVSFWIAAFCACFGTKATRKALFPLMFLFLLIPVPSPIAEGVIAFLQRTSGDALNVLYGLAGVPVFRDGRVFILSSMHFEIARECSGIRSTIALFIMGLMLEHLFLRSNWTKAVLLAAVLPLAILKNALRIFSLSVLANYIDPSFMDSALHHSGGILFFAVAMLCLVLVMVLLRRVEKKYCSAHGQTTAALLSNEESSLRDHSRGDIGIAAL